MNPDSSFLPSPENLSQMEFNLSLAPGHTLHKGTLVLDGENISFAENTPQHGPRRTFKS